MSWYPGSVLRFMYPLKKGGSGCAGIAVSVDRGGVRGGEGSICVQEEQLPFGAYLLATTPLAGAPSVYRLLRSVTRCVTLHPYALRMHVPNPYSFTF